MLALSAAWRDDVAICRAILAHHSFTSIKTLDGVERTALHYAAEKGFREVGELLLQHMDVVAVVLQERDGKTAAQP